MADSRQILTDMAQQFYQDVRFVCQLNPINVVDEDTTSSFNALLARAREVYPTERGIKEFSELSPRNLKYKDALIVAGQFAILVRLLSGRADTFSASIAKATAPADPKAASSSDSQHDLELYGPATPKKVNPDGTIPFSLE